MRGRLGSRLTPLRIALVYLVFGVVALFLSDVVLFLYVGDGPLLHQLQAVKGLLEVLITAVLIFALVSTFHRATQEKTLEAELARDRLAFLNNLIRHHVLNRMNVVQGYVDRLLDEKTTDREGLRTIRRQSTAVVALVDTVRVLSGPMARGQDLKPVDLSATVREELNRARERHPEATFRGTVPEAVEARADDALPLVFEELLDNAVEHNDSVEPVVEVDVEVGDDRVTVRVTDDGPGIPEDALSGPPERERRGHEGMGLFLVRTLVDRYGGDVRVGSADGGGGLVVLELLRTAR